MKLRNGIYIGDVVVSKSEIHIGIERVIVFGWRAICYLDGLYIQSFLMLTGNKPLVSERDNTARGYPVYDCACFTLVVKPYTVG